jgi:hypothetical protein
METVLDQATAHVMLSDSRIKSFLVCDIEREIG